MRLDRRVRALERVRKPPGCCEACGFDFGAPLQMKLTFDEGTDAGPDECPGCGRPLLLRISIRQATRPRER
jgi:ribosomal protein L37AE/L43A